MRRPRRAAAGLVVLLAWTMPAAGSAQSAATQGKPALKHSAPTPAPPRTPRAVPFAAGETLTYDVSWASFLTAGQATLRVLERKASFGSTAYYIVAEGRPTPLLARLYALYYKADTLLDVYSLLPQRASTYSEEGRRHHYKVTTFNHASRTARFDAGGSAATRTLAIDRYALDPLGALSVLRALTLKTGDRFTLPICDAGLTYAVQISVGTVELVKTGIGTVRAWRVTPVLPDNVHEGTRNLTIWVSVDARRLPVKIQAQLAVGSFELTLAK